MNALRNINTNAIERPLSEVLTYLFERYDTIVADDLNEGEVKVKSFKYNLTDPLVTIYTKIEELVCIAQQAKNSYSEEQ